MSTDFVKHQILKARVSLSDITHSALLEGRILLTDDAVVFFRTARFGRSGIGFGLLGFLVSVGMNYFLAKRTAAVDEAIRGLDKNELYTTCSPHAAFYADINRIEVSRIFYGHVHFELTGAGNLSEFTVPLAKEWKEIAHAKGWNRKQRLEEFRAHLIGMVEDASGIHCEIAVE